MRCLIAFLGVARGWDSDGLFQDNMASFSRTGAALEHGTKRVFEVVANGELAENIDSEAMAAENTESIDIVSGRNHARRHESSVIGESSFLQLGSSGMRAGHRHDYYRPRDTYARGHLFGRSHLNQFTMHRHNPHGYPTGAYAFQQQRVIGVPLANETMVEAASEETSDLGLPHGVVTNDTDQILERIQQCQVQNQSLANFAEHEEICGNMTIPIHSSCIYVCKPGYVVNETRSADQIFLCNYANTKFQLRSCVKNYCDPADIVKPERSLLQNCDPMSFEFTKCRVGCIAGYHPKGESSKAWYCGWNEKSQILEWVPGHIECVREPAILFSQTLWVFLLIVAGVAITFRCMFYCFPDGAFSTAPGGRSRKAIAEGLMDDKQLAYEKDSIQSDQDLYQQVWSDNSYTIQSDNDGAEKRKKLRLARLLDKVSMKSDDEPAKDPEIQELNLEQKEAIARLKEQKEDDAVEGNPPANLPLPGIPVTTLDNYDPNEVVDEPVVDDTSDEAKALAALEAEWGDNDAASSEVPLEPVSGPNENS